MKKIHTIFIFIISLCNLYICTEIDPSLYSQLLGTVRKEVVDAALSSLPKREYVNILQMCNKMSSLKVTYSLTNAESAFLIYKWIATNINVDINENNENFPYIYNMGKGNPKGISHLFNLFCKHFFIESDSISGYVRTSNDNIFMSINSTWNYIEINKKYYLVDSSFGAGYYNNKEFRKEYSDIYFATKPEYFIYTHYPSDSKWQMLSQEYTFKKFDSMPYILNEFYLYGFQTFSPESVDINGIGEVKITLTYNETIKGLKFSYMAANSELFEIDTFKADINNNSNGKVEFIFNKSNTETYYFIIFSTQPNGNDPKGIIFYKLNPTK